MTQITDNQSVSCSQTANSGIKCINCSYMGGNVDLGVDYCMHPNYLPRVMEIDDIETQPYFCPLKDVK